MKLPRDLSGLQLVKVLCRNWGYQKVHQEGSHNILRAVANHKNVFREDILRGL